MPTAEAHVPTDRASRYLVQLCSHLSRMSGIRHRPPAGHGGGQHDEGGRRPPKVEHVDYSDTYGTVRFADGRCTLHATSDALTVRVDAADEDALQRVQNGIAGRIEKIGRRERLTVTWSRSAASEDPPGEAAHPTPAPAPAPEARGAEPRRRGMTVAMWSGGGALVVAAHLGAFGAGITASAWTTWGVNAIVAIILLKVVFIAGHVILRRFAPWARRHRPSPQSHPDPQ